MKTEKEKQKIKAEILPVGFEVKNLVGLSWETLQKIFKEMEGKTLSAEELPKWKIMLGFMNATNNTVKTSMQCYKLVVLPLAVEEVKKAMKNKHK